MESRKESRMELSKESRMESRMESRYKIESKDGHTLDDGKGGDVTHEELLKDWVHWLHPWEPNPAWFPISIEIGDDMKEFYWEEAEPLIPE